MLHSIRTHRSAQARPNCTGAADHTASAVDLAAADAGMLAAVLTAAPRLTRVAAQALPRPCQVRGRSSRGTPPRGD
jgi:hypothetical protein